MNPNSRKRGVVSLLARAFRTAVGLDARSEVISSLDRLEERALLSTSPLPTLSMLESPNNTVVRMETNFGEVDIEMFNGTNPITVTNFLNYVRKGQYSESFFHRSVNDFVIQGGGFAYSNTGGATVLPTDAPIALEYNRPNAERTIAMARTNVANSATSQFFINTKDNSTDLGPGGFSPEGYAVFGRVIQGWSVIQQIAGLSIRDLRSDSGVSSLSTNVQTTPVTAEYNQTSGVRESSLVTITNMEIIKPAELQGFFTSTMVMPEGWRSDFTTETVDLFNPNVVDARYQIVAHHEVGGKNTNYEDGSRDRVLSEGVIPAGRKIQVKVSSRGDTSFTPVVRANEGYAMVLKYGFAEGSTNTQPIAADVTRTDFNAQASESFINLDALSTQQKREWAFPRIERNPLSKEYLTFWNPNATDAAITIDFVTPEGPRTFNITLNAYRRGGFALEDQGLAEGILAARVRSSSDIAVTLSDWDLATAGQNVSQTYMPGFMVNGIAGGGAIVGGIGQVIGSTDNRGDISLYNPTATSTSVTLTAYKNDGSTSTQSITLPARSRASVGVNAFTLNDGQAATVLYNSGTVAIAAQYTSIPEANRNLATTIKNDGVATMFQTGIAGEIRFAGTYNPTIAEVATNPPGYRETISIFNPFASDSLGIRVQYAFSDGTIIEAANAPLLARQRVEISTLNQSAVLAKISSGAAFRHYEIIVTGTITPTGASGTTPGLVSYFRDDRRLGQSVMTDGTENSQLLPLSSPLLIGSAPNGTGT